MNRSAFRDSSQNIPINVVTSSAPVLNHNICQPQLKSDIIATRVQS